MSIFKAWCRRCGKMTDWIWECRNCYENKMSGEGGGFPPVPPSDPKPHRTNNRRMVMSKSWFLLVFIFLAIVVVGLIAGISDKELRGECKEAIMITNANKQHDRVFAVEIVKADGEEIYSGSHCKAVLMPGEKALVKIWSIKED